jgi:DNA mismatch repair protein MutS2
LDDIKRARQEAQAAESRARERERQAQLVERDLRYQTANIEEARRAVIAEMRATMQNELAEVRREIEQTRRQLTRSGTVSAGAHEEFLTRAAQEVTRRQQAGEEVDRAVIIPGNNQERLAGPIEVGDRVFVASLQASGEVLAITPNGEADVQLGKFRLKLPAKRLELRQKAVKEPAPGPAIRMRMNAAESPGLELDLRGDRVEQGLDKLDRYLNDASMARLPWVRIIHGKGTGAMRDAVRNVLKGHPLVRDSRTGDLGEGGDGVTVIRLVDS